MRSKVFEFLKKYFSILDMLVCIILAFLFAVSPLYQNDFEYILRWNIHILSRFLVCLIVFPICTICIRMVIEKIAVKEEKSKLDKLFESKYSMIVIALILLICWLPVIGILYPGSLNNDGWGQIKQVDYQLYTNQHPMFDTLVMAGSIYHLAHLWNGKWQLAIFTYTIVQTIIMSFVLAYTLTYSKKKLKINSKILVCFLMIYGLLPIFPGTVQAISKDTLFSWAYVLFLINFLEMIRTKMTCLEKKRNIIYTIIISVLCVFTKRIGIYVVLASFLILLLMNIKSWKNISFIVLVMFAFMIFLDIINQYFSIFHILKIGKEGKYSLFFQHTARYSKYYESEVTQEEKDIINKVLKYDTLVENYNPLNSDTLIDNHVRGSSSQDYAEWLKVWMHQGLKHPKVYIEATLAMTSGWFSTKEFKPLMNMDWHDQLDKDIIPEETTKRPQVNRNLANWLQKKYDELAKIPIVDILLSFGFIASLLPAFLWTTTIKYRKNNENQKVWLGVFPTLISIALGCWLAPVSESTEGIRYLYPIVFTNIMLILWCIYCVKENKKVKL